MSVMGPGGRCCLFLALVCLALEVTISQADCPKPTGNANTVIAGDDINTDTFPEGAEVTFECAVGYVPIQGSRRVTCTNGAWSPLRLKCEIKSCGSPGEIANGHFDTSGGFDFGATVVGICNTGYQLVGSGERHCLEAGWSGRVPVCEVVQCGSPPVIANGEPTLTPEESYTYGQVVRYQCHDDYTLVGERDLTCSENGAFQPAAPECKIVICPTPDIPNARQIAGGRPPYKYKHFVQYQCVTGYTMVGEATLTCEITSEWSAPFPTCEAPSALPTTTKPTTTTTTTTTTTPPRPAVKTTPKEGRDPSPTNKPSPPGGNGGVIAGSTIGALVPSLVIILQYNLHWLL